MAVSLLMVILIGVSALNACSSEPPSLPKDEASMFSLLSGAKGQEFLNEITSFNWADGGATVAESLAWIGQNAYSTNEEESARAGNAAHVLATYLSTEESRLVSGSKWSLRSSDRMSLGSRSPELLKGFATVLIPFQGAVLGDAHGVRGFESMVSHADDYSAAVSLYKVIATSRSAHEVFFDSAYRLADKWASEFGVELAAGKPAPDGIKYVAFMCGVVYGGGQGSEGLRTSQRAEDYASYEVAKAFHPQPGGGIDDKYFNSSGRLLSPGELDSQASLILYSNQVRSFLSEKGFGPYIKSFVEDFNIAVGQ